MKKNNYIFFFGGSACFIALLFCTCNFMFVENIASDKATNVSQLKIASTEISNWAMASSADSFTLWTAANFEQDIDGGYDVYTNRGMIEVADFHMIGPIDPAGEQNTIATRSYIMDCGNDSNAIELYKYWQIYNSADAFKIPRYKTTTAFAIAVQGGITVYAHFKKFYFELKLFGFSSQPQAAATAVQFLGLFRAKVE
jgi:hypothetical protein